MLKITIYFQSQFSESKISWIRHTMTFFSKYLIIWKNNSLLMTLIDCSNFWRSLYSKIVPKKTYENKLMYISGQSLLRFECVIWYSNLECNLMFIASIKLGRKVGHRWTPAPGHSLDRLRPSETPPPKDDNPSGHTEWPILRAGWPFGYQLKIHHN